MKDKEDVREILHYFESIEGKKLQLEGEAIVDAYQKENNQSLSVKIFSCLGGFFASAFFVLTLLVAGIFDSDIGLLIMGLTCIIASVWLNKKSDNIIIDTISIQLFIAGFLLLSFAFDMLGININAICVLFIIIACIAMFIIHRNYILLRFQNNRIYQIFCCCPSQPAKATELNSDAFCRGPC